MKRAGHIRYAWAALYDLRTHLDALTTDQDLSEASLGALALERSGELRSLLRPMLDGVERSTYNDNGETPLELAHEALAAHGRFLHCFELLSSRSAAEWGTPPVPPDVIEELASWKPRLEALVKMLELKEARTKGAKR